MSLESRFDGQARMDRLAAIVAFIDSFCVLHGVDRRDALRLTLLVEELFTNTVRHGHRGDSDAPVQVALQVEPARVSLIYADTAPSFDPLAWLAQSGATQATAQAELADRPVGQLGLHLVAQIATRSRYERSDGWNRLWLELDRQT
jgi:serine/threonine-protein kinase RsbW